MAVPLLILGAAGIAGLVGIGNGAKAIQKNSKAKHVNKEAQATYDKALETANKARENAQKALEALGEAKLKVLSGTMNRFVEAFEQLHDIELEESGGLDELRKFHVDKQEFQEMRTMSNMAKSMLGGVAGGAGAGALAAFGAYGATMTFASASTGTAIASLSGAAATNATLAFLGGGSIAAGGFGMAGGTVVLGGAVAGPAICVLGVVLNAAASKNLDSAYINLATVKEEVEGIKIVATLCKGVSKRAEMFTSLLNYLNSGFDALVTDLECVITTSGYDYSKLAPEEKATVSKSLALAQAIKQVLDTPILNEGGAVTEESQKVYDELAEQYMAEVDAGVLKTSSAYQKALVATLFFFAKCDGSISPEEMQVLNQYVFALFDDTHLSKKNREQLLHIRDEETSEFSSVSPYLDMISIKELTDIKSYVAEVIIASDGISDAEKEAYRIFMHYYVEKTSGSSTAALPAVTDESEK